MNAFRRLLAVATIAVAATVCFAQTAAKPAPKQQPRLRLRWSTSTLRLRRN